MSTSSTDMFDLYNTDTFEDPTEFYEMQWNKGDKPDLAGYMAWAEQMMNDDEMECE